MMGSASLLGVGVGSLLRIALQHGIPSNIQQANVGWKRAREKKERKEEKGERVIVIPSEPHHVKPQTLPPRTVANQVHHLYV